MKFASVCVAALLLVPGCRCGSQSAPLPAEPAAHQDEKEHDELPRQVRLPEGTLTSSGIKTEISKRSVLATTVKLPGEIVSEPDRTARLSSATAGRLEQVNFNEGALVTKGQPLAILRVPDVGRLRGAFAAVTAKAKAAAANAQRLRLLKESGLGAEQVVIDAEADAHAQEAEANALGEQLSAIGVNSQVGSGFLVTLRAPISGVVVSRDAVVGQPINAEHVLATVVDLSEVWFLGRVFEKDLGRLETRAKADVQLNAFPQEHFEGVVEYVGQQTDPVARTLTARIRLKNPKMRLRIGLFGSAQVAVSEPTSDNPRIIIPRDAVTEVAGKSVVFVKAKDGDFVVHDVELGDSALSSIQVLSGLSEGEEVVVEGVFTLKSLMLKSTLSEDEH